MAPAERTACGDHPRETDACGHGKAPGMVVYILEKAFLHIISLLFSKSSLKWETEAEVGMESTSLLNLRHMHPNSVGLIFQWI